jgi:hypothetical protein
MASNLLKIKDSSGDLKVMTDADEHFIAYIMASDPISTSTNGCVLVGSASGNTDIGQYVNTYFNQSIGTHPGSSITSGSTTSTFIQKGSGSVLNESNALFRRPVTWDSASDGIKELTDSEMNFVADRILSYMLTNEWPGVSFRLASSTPTGYTAHQANAVSDTQSSNGSVINYSIYKKGVMPSNPGTNRPIAIKYGAGGEFEGLEELTDAEIKYTFGEWIRGRLFNRYVLLPSTLTPESQGLPGTWQARGTITDTKDTTSDVNYVATYSGNYTSSYVGNYVGNYTNESLNFSAIYSGNYTRGYLGNYVGNYVNENINFSAVYTGNYTRGYLGNYVGNYVNENVTFAATYSADYLGNYVGNYTGNYVNENITFSANYTSGFVGNYVGNYTGNYVNENITFSANYITGFLGNYVGNYTNENAVAYVRYRVATYDKTVPYVRPTYSRGVITYARGTGQAAFSRTNGINYLRGGAALSYSRYYYNAWGGDTISSGYTRTYYLGPARYQRLTYNRGGSIVTYLRGTGQASFSRTNGINYLRGGAAASYSRYYYNAWGSDTISLGYTRSFYAGPPQYQRVTYNRGILTYVRGTGQASFSRGGAGVNYLRGGAVASYSRYYYNWGADTISLGYTRGYYIGTFTGNFTGNYLGTVAYAGTYSATYLGDFVGNYVGNVTYSKAYAGTYSATYTGNFTGNYVGNVTYSGVYSATYVGDYVGNYTGNYVGTVAYAGTYSATYTGDYIGNYTGDYVGTVDYTGTYSATYTGDYVGNYTGDYIGTRSFAGTYSGTYVGDFVGNYTGNYAGLTINATDQTVESYTLYTRVL